MLNKLRETEALLTTEHKQSADDVSKALTEKAEDRKKAKEDKFQILKEEYAEEKKERKRMLDLADSTQQFLEEEKEVQREFLQLFRTYVEATVNATTAKQRKL